MQEYDASLTIFNFASSSLRNHDSPDVPGGSGNKPHQMNHKILVMSVFTTEYSTDKTQLKIFAGSQIFNWNSPEIVKENDIGTLIDYCSKIILNLYSIL